MASGVRTLELAKSLRKFDVEPVVFSPYEQSHIKDGVEIVNVQTLFSNQRIQNAAYRATRGLYYNRRLQGLIVKMSKMVARGLLASPNLAETIRSHDVEIVQAEQDNAAMILLSARRFLSLPIVLDLHGIWPEELLAAGAIREGCKIWNDLQELMMYITNNVDLTVCLSEAMKDYVLKTYDVCLEKAIVVPPGGRVRSINHAKRAGQFRVVYAGIVSYRKHVDLFVKSMPYLKKKKPDVTFYITNKGDLLSRIQELAKRLKVSPTYFWLDDLQQTLEFLSSCHVGALPSTNDTSSRISMPSKLFDYLSVGVPVVANEVGGWTDIIRKNNLGRVTRDDPEDFARGITELLDSPEEMAKTADRGMELIRKTYNWDVSAKLLAQSYEALLQK